MVQLTPLQALCLLSPAGPQIITPERVSADVVGCEKRSRRGGFEAGLMLIKTAMPHSIQPPSSNAFPASELSATPAAISDAASLPRKEFYYRPDLRHVEQDIEKLLTFETEATKLGEIRQVLNFPLALGHGSQRDFTLTVELRRSRASVRGVVRLRTGPEQLELDFSNKRE